MEFGVLWGPIAVFSDVHGNSWAMEAVLDDIERRGIRQLVDLGNAYCGPLDPLATAKLLDRRAASRVCVKGRGERRLCDNSVTSPEVGRVRSLLGEARIAALARIPQLRESRSTSLFNGCRHDDAAYLLESVNSDGTLGLANDETIDRRLHSLPDTVHIVACGRSHVSRTITLARGTVIVNPGSVGLPAFETNFPAPHRVENGTHHARYAVLRLQDSSVEVEHVAVPYDCKAAARKALENGRSDWAGWLTTGRTSGGTET